MNGHLGDDSPDTLDLTAIAADDALLDLLAADSARPAVTWDGTIEEPTPIADAVIWTDEPIRPPAGPPIKKSRSEASVDGAARLLALVVADADSDLAGAVERMRAAQLASGVLATPGVTWSQADVTSVDGAVPGLTWGRLARRTGTRGAAVLAALAVSVGGVAAASVVAGPGNPLYPVHKLFAGPNPVQEQAYAVARVSAALDEAQGALDAHKPGSAHGKLTVAQERLRDVVAGTDKDRLVARLDALTALVALATPTPGAVTVSPTPVLTDTESPAPSQSDGTTPSTDPTTTPGVEPTRSPSGDATSSAEPGKDGKDHGKDGKDHGDVVDPGRGTTGNSRDDHGGKVSGKEATGGKGGAGKGGNTRNGQGRHHKVSEKKSPGAGSGGSVTHSGDSGGSGSGGGGSSGGDAGKIVSLHGQD